MTDMGCSGSRPIKDDEERQKKATQGVKEPDLGIVANEWKYDAKSVKDDIRHRVLCESLHT